MSDIQITVASKLPPFAAGKPGKVIDNTGKTWGAFRPLWDQLYEGGSYIVQFTTFQGNNGQTYFTIRQAQPSGTPQLINGQQQPPLPVRPIAQAIPPTDNQRRLDIFIDGAFNNWVRAGCPETTQMDYIDELHKLKSAWLAVFGPSPLPPRQQQPDPRTVVGRDPISSGPDPEMNDDIPF